jgi:tetratricopeptide (TPR) repeat protein
MAVAAVARQAHGRLALSGARRLAGRFPRRRVSRRRSSDLGFRRGCAHCQRRRGAAAAARLRLGRPTALAGRGFGACESVRTGRRDRQRARWCGPSPTTRRLRRSDRQAAGQITREAEAIFKEALKEDPKDLKSRIYMGEAALERGDKAGALEFWKGVLAAAPPDEWRTGLMNRVAVLTAETGDAAPNPMAMVAQLASQLESNPNDLDGWVMLIRPYAFLGDKDKAAAALTKARTIFANEAQAQAALVQLAKRYPLN